MGKSIFSQFRTAFPGITFREGNLCFKRHLLVAFLMLCSVGVGGQILTFDFVGIAGNESTANSNFNNTNLLNSTVSRGMGLTAPTNGDRFNGSNWAITSIANALLGNNYVEFTITPKSGFQFSVTSIVVQWQRSGTGNTDIALRSSVDSYGTNLDAVKIVTDNTSTQTFTYTFSQANSSTAVTYRLYSYAEATGGTGGPGDGTGNDIIVNGTVTAAGKTSNCAVCSWNDANAWLPIGVPAATDAVTIRSTDIIYNLNANLLRTAATNVNGSFQIEQNSSVDTGSSNFNYGTTGTLIFNNSSPYYGVNSNDKFWTNNNGPINVKVLQGGFILNSGVSRTIAGNLETASGISLASGEKLTVNGTTTINQFGFFNQAPTYGPASKLIYNTGAVYNRGLEWSSNVAGVGYPNEVQVSGNTTINYPSTGSGAFSQPLGVEKNLTIDVGSSLFMGYGDNGNKSGSLTIGGNLVNNGNFGLGNAIGGDFILKGNWTKGTGANFYANERSVNFTGTSVQTITGATTFDYLTINNSSGVILASPIINSLTLDFTNGKITLGANNLTIGSGGTIINTNAAKYVVTNGTGQLKRTVGAGNVLFPVGNSAYNPITFNNTGGTSEIYGVRVADTTPAGANPTKTVNRQWITTEAVPGGSNLSVVAQYNTGETGAGFVAGTNPFIGFYDGTVYTHQVAATLAVLNPFTATSNVNLTPTDLTTGTKYFAIGKDNGLVSVPNKYAVDTITPASPIAGSGFSAKITALDAYGAVTTISSNSTFTLTTNGNAGAISGITTGTINSGNNSVTVSVIILPNPGTGVTITATNTSGLLLATGTSAPFTVLGVATQLKFVGVPATGIAGSNLASFTVEARRADNSVDTNFTGNISIAKASGTGNFSGILTKSAVAGVATFNNIQFDAAGTYTITTTSGTLTTDTSGNIVISPNPANAFFRSNVTTGNWSSPVSWQSSNDGITWSTATVVPTEVATTISIRSGNTITINTNVILDQVVINNGGHLIFDSGSTTSTNKLTINDDPGIDFDIENGGVFQVIGTGKYPEAIFFLSNSKMNVNGKILIGDGIATNGSDYDTFATKTNQIIWNHAAIFEWKSAGIFGANAKTFFPDVNSTTVPIFRFSIGNGSAGGGTATIINGIYEINGVTSNWTGDSKKIFRNGIRSIGTGNMVNSGSGTWEIGDATGSAEAELGGTTGNLTLTNANGISVLPSCYASLTSSVNLGANTKFNVSSGATLDFGFNGGNALNILGNSGGQTFSAASGSTLKITSPYGITKTTAGPTAGNVQIPINSRSFDAGATYHYIGKVSQTTGNGLPEGLTNKVIVDLETDATEENLNFASSGINKFNSSGTLEIRKGKVIDAPNNGFRNNIPIENENGELDAQKGNIMMTGGKYVVSGSGTKPSLSGTYTLNAGTVEFTGTAATKIRTSVTPKQYFNVDVSGSNVESGGKNFIVNNLLKVTTATAILKVPEETDSANPYVVTAKKGIQVATGGKALFLNNANLIQDIDAGNTGNINMQRKANIPSIQYNYWSSPVVGQSLYSLYDVPANSVMTYNSWNDRFTILPTASNPISIFAKGYSIKGSSTMNPALTAEFVGTPNNETTAGTNSIALSTSGNNYNLIGNPYPSNLNLITLYNDPTNIAKFYNEVDETPTVYFWDNTSNTETSQQGSSYVNQNYALLNLSSGIGVSAPRLGLSKKPNGIVKPGQGFIMRAAETGGNLTFKNTFRTTSVGTAGTYFKNAAETTDKFWLTLTTPVNMNISIALAYNPEAEDSFERFDSAVFSEGVTENFYSLSSDSKKLAIQTRKGDFNVADIIPLGFKTSKTGIQKISIDEKEGVFEFQTIYLKDKTLNIITDLSSGSYEFSSSLGVDNNRFEIIYKPGSVLGTEANTEEKLQVYRSGEDFIILSSAKKITEVEIYDSSGRLYRKLQTNTLRVDLEASDISSGMYILKIKMSDETVTKKIIK